MKKNSISLLLCIAVAQSLFGNESLMLKRISEFWKDEAFEQAKAQILQFLTEYPGSTYCDNLHAMLGDLYIQEEDYEKALKSYDQILSQELQSKIEINYLQALFELGDFRSILKKANRKSSEPKVHYLTGEACFRLGRQAPDPETQKSLYIQAASHYNQLSASPYAYDVLWPLAEIYKTLGESSKAASLYLELAANNPEQKETLLFQAAYLQTNFNKNLAAETFAKVYSLQGKNANSAAYNHLTILFEEKQYKEFLFSYEKISKNLSQDKINSLQFCVSKSYFELGDLEKAAATLEFSRDKPSCLLLAACAEKLNDVDLLDKATQKLTQLFPNDLDTAKAHLISTQISLDRGDSLRAQKNLEHVIKNFPEYPDREKLLCDYATILSRNTLWKESRIAFQEFLVAYPNSIYKDEAWRQLVNVTLKEGNREIFTNTLGSALTQSKAFSNEERQQYHLLWIKLLFEQDNKKEVANQLIHFLDSFPDSAEGHLLAAAFYEEDPLLFKTHAEHALKVNPYIQDSEQLHLKLYNIYIQTPGEQDRAADHLFHCAATSTIALKEENLQWLSNHFFNKKEDAACRKKAIFLYEKMAQNELSPSFEKEILKYAELLQIEGDSKHRLNLLEKLSKKQQELSTLPWKYQRQTLFELAKGYSEIQENEKAVDVYNLLITTSTHMPSYFSRAATLERARLQYALLSDDEKQENSPKTESILNSLKDLQVKKKLHSEPLHLEAALEYVQVMCAFAAPDKKVERNIFLLKRVKEDFSSKKDLFSKEYHSQRSVLPDKAAILENYLYFIDAEIFRLEGKIKRAEKIYQKLQKKILDPALQKRVNTSMEIVYDVN